MLKINKKHWENIFCFLIFYTFILFSQKSFAADSLSYSGRLVKADGSPVAGPVNLKIDLSYTDFPNTILCSQNFSSVVLSNGVFHLKLDLVCPGPPAKTVTEILSAVPATFAAALRVSDVTNSKIYAFQEIHSMPFATVSESAKQLAQLGAVNGEVLKWNDTTKKWEPGTPGGGGTVTNVTATSPLAVTNGATTPALTITQATTSTDGYLSATDWNTFNNKVGVTTGGTTLQFYRGDNSWQTLNTDVVPDAGMTNLYFTNARALGVPLAGLNAALAGVIQDGDTMVVAFGKTQAQINSINTDSTKYLIKNATDAVTGEVTIHMATGSLLLPRTPSDAELTAAANVNYVKTYADTKLSLSGGTLTNDLTLNTQARFKGGSNYVELKANAALPATISLTLPMTVGGSGDVLTSNGAGVLSWVNPSSVAAGASTVTSASITDGTIMDIDVNSSAGIAQSKIANLTTDLGNKVSSTLATGKVLVGSAGNIATAVSVSGDATLSDLGALTLANSGVVASTYKSVTVDVKGRVTGGTNPTTLAGFGITDTLVTGVTATAPITVTGTTAPLIAMPAATNAVDGYLTAADRTAFNAKQTAITATTTLNSREIRFNELTGNGAEYVSLKAPDALTANTTYTLPAADGSSGQVLTTNAAGILSWSTVATSGTTLAGDIGGTIGANSIGTGKVTSTHLLDGTIVNADINATAAIAYSKLNVPALAIPLTTLNASGTKDATKYLKGDDTWSVLQTDVQALLLSSYTIGTNAVVATGDSIVSAFGKLQKQITDLTTRAVGGDLTGNLPNPTIAKIQGSPVSITTPATKQVLKYNGTTWVNAQVAAADLSATGTVDGTTYLAGDNSWKNFNSGVIAAPITGVNTTGITKANSGLVGTDSLLIAFNKLLFTQGDYVSKTANQTINGTLAINSLTGFITVPTPIGATDAANKGYVDSYGQWLEGTGGNINDIYFNTGKVGIGTTSPANKLHVGNTLSGGVNDPVITIESFVAGGEWLDLGVGTSGSLISFSDTGFLSFGKTSDKGNVNSGDTEFMRITNTGNVGIGTSTPGVLPNWSMPSQSRVLEISGDGSASNSAEGILLLTNNRATATLGDELGAFGFGHKNNPGNFPGVISSHLTGSGGANGFGGTLDFYTKSDNVLGHSQRMRIDQNGNVGIGTTSPISPLHAYGGTAMTAGYKRTATFHADHPAIQFKGISDTNHSGGIGYDSQSISEGMRFWVGATSDDLHGTGVLAMNIKANGNVGIGTISPDFKLRVTGKAKFGTETDNVVGNYVAGVNDVLELVSPNASNSPGMSFHHRGNHTVGLYSFGTSVTSQGLQIKSGSGEQPAQLLVEGNVGIGTTLPNFTLDVPGSFRAAGTARMTLARTMTNVLGDTVALGSLSNNGKATWARIRLNAHNGGNIDAVIFEVYLPAYQHIATTTGWQELPTLAGSSGWQGNIAYIVDVYRQDPLNAAAPFFFRVRNRNGTGNGALDVVIEYDDHSTFTAYTTASNVATAFNNVTAPAGGPIDGFYGGWAYSFPVSQGHAWNASTGAGLFIKNSGNVGIGTADPTYTLHVVGSAGLSSGTAWTNASDIRLKDIHSDYEYGLNEILKLHTVRYSYKKDNPLALPSDFSKTGFIAQEVQKVIPDAVTKRKDGYLELNVDPIHWAVVNSIKDLYRKHILPLWESDKKQERAIASLEEENKKLKDENKDIRERLLRLEKNMVKNK